MPLREVARPIALGLWVMAPRFEFGYHVFDFSGRKSLVVNKLGNHAIAKLVQHDF
jgi:hypothetical protein